MNDLNFKIQWRMIILKERQFDKLLVKYADYSEEVVLHNGVD